MAYIELHDYSEVLGLDVQTSVLLPWRKKGSSYADLPVLYLLHGRSDDQSAWMRSTAIERYVEDRQLMVVMPAAHLSYYTDMAYGQDYFRYISEELPQQMADYFPVSQRREDTAIAGLSMGGFGAFKCALNSPQRYGYAGSFSGVLDLPARVEESRDEPATPRARIFKNCFGDRACRGCLEGTKDDLISLALEQTEQPKLFQCCGTEDFLYQNNQDFRNACLEAGRPVTYLEWQGVHDWEFWDTAIQEFLKWLPLG